MIPYIPKENIEALRIIYDLLKDTGLTWILTGSSALVIHGVNVEAKDIDILTDMESADKIASILNDYIIEPMHHKTSSQFKSYYGLFKIYGTQVELIVDTECIYNDKWVKMDNLNTILYKIFEGMKIPLLDLKEEYEAYKKMGRMERAKKILEAMK